MDLTGISSVFSLASQELIEADWQFQEVGGTNNALYEIQLAIVTFDDIPADPNGTTSITIPVEGGARRLSGFGSSHHWITLLSVAQVFYIASIHMW